MRLISTKLKSRYLDIAPSDPNSTSIVDLQRDMACGHSDPLIYEVDHLCAVYPSRDMRAYDTHPHSIPLTHTKS